MERTVTSLAERLWAKVGPSVSLIETSWRQVYPERDEEKEDVCLRKTKVQTVRREGGVEEDGRKEGRLAGRQTPCQNQLGGDAMRRRKDRSEESRGGVEEKKSQPLFLRPAAALSVSRTLM